MWVCRGSRNYFNLLPSIFDMVYSNTNPECKLKQWSLAIQPSDTPASNNASEESCTENLTIFRSLFNLHVEEERINVQKGRIFFYVWKIILMESFRGKKKSLGSHHPTPPPEWKREGRGMGAIGLPFHLCMHIHKYMCVCVYTHILCLTTFCWESSFILQLWQENQFSIRYAIFMISLKSTHLFTKSLKPQNL